MIYFFSLLPNLHRGTRRSAGRRAAKIPAEPYPRRGAKTSPSRRKITRTAKKLAVPPLKGAFLPTPVSNSLRAILEQSQLVRQAQLCLSWRKHNASGVNQRRPPPRLIRQTPLYSPHPRRYNLQAMFTWRKTYATCSSTL